jgi:hypothetical protein
MGSHEAIQARTALVKFPHNERAKFTAWLRDLPQYDPRSAGRSEKLRVLDELHRAALPAELARNPRFLEKVGTVALADAPRKREVAESQARDYCPNKSDGLAYITDLLLAAAAEPDMRARASVVASAAFTAIWTDEERLSAADPERAPRDATLETIRRGARRFARFGAHRCIACDYPLEDVYEYGARGLRRRSRRTHCDRCKHDRPRSLLTSDVKEMRLSILVATGQARPRRAEWRDRRGP